MPGESGGMLLGLAAMLTRCQHTYTTNGSLAPCLGLSGTQV